MRVALAISSYNGDLGALDLVRKANDESFAGMFTGVAVVDSGEPVRCAQLRDALLADHAEVEYQWHDGNLGAAKNLHERLVWAEARSADAVLAVNADGHLQAENVRTLIGLMDRTGAAAVYPTAVLEGGHVDLSYRQPVPVLPSRRPIADLAGKSIVTVSWGSSNGALYRLKATGAVRFGAVEDLWHGWEDLALGLLLREGDGLQMMSLEAAQPTSSDQRRLGANGPVISHKEPWTTYYSVRNLVLIGGQHRRLRHRVALRVVREFVTILLRDRHKERYAQAVRGLQDGLRGRTGLRVPPTS